MFGNTVRIRSPQTSNTFFIIRALGEASNGPEAIALAGRLQPDVIVTDLIMPEITGIEIVRRVQGLPRIPRVVILSMHESESYVLEVLKTAPPRTC